MADHRGRRTRGSRRRLFVVAGAVLLVLIAGGVAWAASRPAASTYRTATAGPAAVTDLLSLTGTVEPVTETTVKFPVSGQVDTVSVQQGQQVGAGQPLAQLNTTSLANAVDSAQATVATAQLKLANDQASQTSTVSTSTSSGSSSSGSSGSGSSGSRSSSSSAASAASSAATKSLAALSGEQTAVRGAQSTVDSDLTLVTAAVKQENATCPPVIQSLSTATSSTASSSSNAHTTSSSASSTSNAPTSSTGTMPSGPSQQQVTDCTTIMQQVLADQNRAAADEKTLASAEAALTQALAKAESQVEQAATSASSGSTGSSSTGSGSSGSGSSGSGSGSSGSSGSRGSGGSSGQPASADQLAADQASVDAANAQLAEAEQSLAAASLVAPISGTVAQIGLTPGTSVSANSSTADIVIIGPGTSEVTTAVTDSQVGSVKPGQHASVLPDGGSTPISGTVTAIGALDSTTSSGSASYPVTISLEATGQPLFAGSNATVSITLNSAAAAVTVPTSAVRSTGALHVVEVLENGKPTVVRVTVGVVGSTLTQIISGLSAGQQVVLADLTAALPSSNTSNRGFTGGGFGGGGGGGRIATGGGTGGAGGGTGGGRTGG